MEYRVNISPVFVSLIFISSALVSMAQMEGDMRLVGMNSSHKGRVELFYEGQWGTICNNDYGLVSRVICYQLNFTSFPASYYAKSVRNLEESDKASLSSYSNDKPIHFWDIDCGPVFSNPPSVIHLLRCDYEEIDENINCTHADDLVVFCNESNMEEPYLTQVRLVKSAGAEIEANNSSSTFSSSGTLEIFLNSTWGNVCYTNFSQYDGDTACRQLGYTGVSSIYQITSKTTDTLWLNNVECNSSKPCLNNCFEAEHVVKQSNCDNELYVGLECSFNRSVNTTEISSGNPIMCNYTKRYSKVPAYFIGIMGGAFLEWVIAVTMIIVTAVCFTKETCPGYKYRIRMNNYVVLD